MTVSDPGIQPAARIDEAAQAIRLLEQAFNHFDEAAYDDALGACQAALALDPESSTAHSLLGMIYERLGKTGQAVEEYRTVLEMNPDSIADQIKLESLVNGPVSSTRGRVGRLLRGRGRASAVAGATVGAAVLVVGVWAASRGGGSVPARTARSTSHSFSSPQPGPSLAPETTSPTTATSNPTPEAASLSPQARGISGTAVASGAGASPAAPSSQASLPTPPPTNAWPGPPLRGAYPPAPSLDRSAQRPGGSRPAERRGSRAGYLPPAPIGGLESIDSRQAGQLAAVPGAALPITLNSPRTPPSRGNAPVLPPAVPTGEAPRATATEGSAASAAAPPPSASINIQPLDESSPAQTPRTTQTVSPPVRPPSLSQAMVHQQMAAYYRRQGDDQAAYGEYRYARDLFRQVQDRGGRDAAIAAQGAAAAENGMSRLQGP